MRGVYRTPPRSIGRSDWRVSARVRVFVLTVCASYNMSILHIISTSTYTFNKLFFRRSF